MPPSPKAPAPWRASLCRAVTRTEELLALLGLDPGALPHALDPDPSPGLRVPRELLARMVPGDPLDPLLLQVLPLSDERAEVPGFCQDPLDETRYCPAPGLLHKYRGRALLLASGGCALSCRFCFRRHRAVGPAPNLDQALDYLAGQPGVEEVILSGGDPLLLDDEPLAELVTRLEALPRLRRLRLHTRLPVVIPARVTQALCQLLGRSRLRAVVVLHCNHPNELDAAAEAALGRLCRAGVTLLNQAVLLRRVNHTLKAQQQLWTRLFEAGVLPYYLHQLDRVAGAAHFALSDAEARALHRELRATLPGYLVPRLVRELPGRRGKTPL